jgi:hypothetical protein
MSRLAAKNHFLSAVAKEKKAVRDWRRFLAERSERCVTRALQPEISGDHYQFQ